MKKMTLYFRSAKINTVKKNKKVLDVSSIVLYIYLCKYLIQISCAGILHQLPVHFFIMEKKKSGRPLKTGERSENRTMSLYPVEWAKLELMKVQMGYKTLSDLIRDIVNGFEWKEGMNVQYIKIEKKE